jgi:hypothetical protein
LIGSDGRCPKPRLPKRASFHGDLEEEEEEEEEGKKKKKKKKKKENERSLVRIPPNQIHVFLNVFWVSSKH